MINLLRRASSKPAWLPATIFVLACVAFVRARAYSANDLSRLASIESLVERGRWAIDGSPFDKTVDRIKVGNSYYSDKPPLLSFMGAGLYALLHRGFGLTLQAQGCVPELAPSGCRAVLESGGADWAYVILTLLLITSAGGVVVGLACAYAKRLGYSTGFAVIFSLVLGLGTGLFPYSTAFSNHVPSAMAVLVAIYLLLTRPEGGRVTLAWAGAWATLGMLLDLSAGVFLVTCAFYVLWRYRRGAVWFCIGALPFITLAGWLDYRIVGNPFPPQMYTPGYAYAGSGLEKGMSGFKPPANVGRYAFDLLVGEHGLVGYFPIVAIYGLGLAQVLATKKAKALAARPLAWVMTFAASAYVLYFLLATDSFGGYAYGARWFLVPIPMLALLSLHAKDVYRSGWQLAIVGGLAVLSLIGGYWGAVNVWRPTWPLWRVALAPYHAKPETPAVSISGYGSLYLVPEELRLGLPPNNIGARTFDAGQGLVIPTRSPAWWFIAAITPLPVEVAEPLGLQLSGASAFYTDLKPRVDEWLKTFKTTVVETVPGQLPAEALAPVYFHREIALLAYQARRQGVEVMILSAWTLEQAPPYGEQRSIFIHLIRPDGQLVRQTDALAVDLRGLRPGDEWLQLHRLSLAGLPAGTYLLHLGVYNPQTGAPLATFDGAPDVELDGKWDIP